MTGTAEVDVGSTATAIAQVNPNGNPTTYWFEYGTSSVYGTRTAVRTAGSGRGQLSAADVLVGLTPLTTYHFRITASDCDGCRDGTVYGADGTFSTGGYANSVYGPHEAPDPFVLDNDNGHNDYWAFTTGNLFPILHSSDLVHWTSVGTAMSARPAWVKQAGNWHPWSPNVLKAPGSCPGTTSSSCYVMYYTALSAQFSVNCIAVATATVPAGPYGDLGPLSNGTLDAAGRPIGCGDDNGYGMIDPSLFVNPRDGRGYLYGSEDFACPPASTSCTAANSTLRPTISVIPLAGNLWSGSGARTPLFSGDPGTWETSGVAVPTVEGPTATLHDGSFYLFYSAGSWHSQYGMGYATARTPVGPFTKAAGNPVLSSSKTVLGPGGSEQPVVGPRGFRWLVYHGRDSSPSNARTLRIDPFSWRQARPAPDVPVISGPTGTPQPAQP